MSRSSANLGGAIDEIGGSGINVPGGEGFNVPGVPSVEASSIVVPAGATSSAIDYVVVFGPVGSVTGLVSIVAYSAGTFSIRMLANLVCLSGLVSPVGGELS